MLQREFPKEVKYASKPVNDGRLVSDAASALIHTSPLGPEQGGGGGGITWGWGPYSVMSLVLWRH